ncbi:MAG: XTP/dITP diphosphatase [Clostridia bacterium]|nr:XTP/dITP diphosphatase [Clostridia bacterium]
MKKIKIIAATGNKNKLKEFGEIFSSYGFDVEMKSAAQCGVHDFPEETESTFIGNAFIKAQYMYDNVEIDENTVVLADDSGLSVDALDGAPGVFSARYAGEDATDDDRINKLLSELKNVPEEKRTAAFVCSIAVILPDGKKLNTDGYMKGRIAFEKKGENGFGYDPIMYIPEFNKTVAELSSDEKNKISHRGEALRIMADKIKNVF